MQMDDRLTPMADLVVPAAQSDPVLIEDAYETAAEFYERRRKAEQQAGVVSPGREYRRPRAAMRDALAGRKRARLRLRRKRIGI
jgi:hypothetical protein